MHNFNRIGICFGVNLSSLYANVASLCTREESRSFGTLVTGNSPLPHHVEKNRNKNKRNSMHTRVISFIISNN